MSAEWKGKPLATIDEIMQAAFACTTSEEAEEFVAVCKTQNEHALGNMAYCAGYYSREQAEKFYDLFDCEHPVWGKEWPSPEAALAAGMRIGELSKEHGYQKALEIYQRERRLRSPWFLGALDSLIKPE